MRAQFVLNSWESRQLIAKGIIKHPLVNNSLKSGIIAIGRGMTNAFILRELLQSTGNSDFDVDFDNYVAGVVNKDGSLWISNSKTRAPEVAFFRGKPKSAPVDEVISDMGSKDILIKGGNALGIDGVAGVLCAHPKGGTIGFSYATAIVRGVRILVPISLAKTIPISLTTVVSKLGGQTAIDYVQGYPVSLFPIVGGETFTEIEAFELLADVQVYPIGSGGIYKGTGAVILEVVGKETEVQKTIEIVKSIKDTPALEVNLEPR